LSWICANHEKSRAEIRIAKIAMGIVFLYILSWSPYATVALIGQFGPKKLVTPLVSEHNVFVIAIRNHFWNCSIHVNWVCAHGIIYIADKTWRLTQTTRMFISIGTCYSTYMTFCCIFSLSLIWSTVALIGQFGPKKLVTPLVSELPVMLAKTCAMHNPIVYAFSHP
jgi:hypothetical protein